MIGVLLFAVVLLAVIGAKTVMVVAFQPWNLLTLLAEVAALVLVVRLLWVEIGNLRKGSPK